MASRRSFDRAPLDSRSYREPLDGRVERYDVRDDRYDARNDRYDVREDTYSRGYEPREARYDRQDRYDRSFDRPAGPSELDQDFAAMMRVRQMLRAGEVRIVCEIGRQILKPKQAAFYGLTGTTRCSRHYKSGRTNPWD